MGEGEGRGGRVIPVIPIIPTACFPTPKREGAAQPLQIRDLQEAGEGASQEVAKGGASFREQLWGGGQDPHQNQQEAAPRTHLAARTVQRVSRGTDAQLARLREWGELPARSCGPFLGADLGQEPPKRRNGWDKIPARPLGSAPLPGRPPVPSLYRNGPEQEGSAWPPPAQQVLSTCPPGFLRPPGHEHPSCPVSGARGPVPPDPFPCLNILLPNRGGEGGINLT